MQVTVHSLGQIVTFSTVSNIMYHNNNARTSTGCHTPNNQILACLEASQAKNG